MKTPPTRLREGIDGPPRLVRAINEILAYCIATAFVRAVGARVRQTTRGVSLISEPGEEAIDGVSVKQFRRLDMFDDYFTAHPSSEGGIDNTVTVKIAKPYKLRKNPWETGTHIIALEDGTATPPEVSVSYSYLTNTFRFASASNGETENQVIIPQYRPGDIIYAAEPIGGTEVTVEGVRLTWLDINADGRAWGRVS